MNVDRASSGGRRHQGHCLLVAAPHQGQPWPPSQDALHPVMLLLCPTRSGPCELAFHDHLPYHDSKLAGWK